MIHGWKRRNLSSMSNTSRLPFLRLMATAALAIPLAALALAGCATLPAGSQVSAIQPPKVDTAREEDLASSNYGLFLAGEAALHAGRAARMPPAISPAPRRAPATRTTPIRP